MSIKLILKPFFGNHLNSFIYIPIDSEYVLKSYFISQNYYNMKTNHIYKLFLVQFSI